MCIIKRMERLQLAVQYFEQNKFAEAEELALAVFNFNSQSVEAIDVLAAIFLRTNNLNFLKDATINELDLIRKIAVFLQELKTFEQAEFFFKKAIELYPVDSVAYSNLGLIYEEFNELKQAENSYLSSIKIKKNYPALYNLGVLYRKINKLDKSIEILKEALKINPDNNYAHYSLGMSYFKKKDFINGYPYFLRRPVQNAAALKNFWYGQKEPQNTILVFCEYGLGDAIMFSRYFLFLKDYFKNVKVCCQTSLISIFQKAFPAIEFVESVEKVEYDFAVLAMDLPYFLKMDFGNIPNKEGYLKADFDKVKVFEMEYFKEDVLTVGIFYSGGELEKRNAKHRAIPLKKMQKLFKIPNIKVYSFQKEDRFSELKDFPEIVDLGKEFSDFSDTAAAMQNLDVMITIDSAPVHLAGALGVKTFLMLPYFYEWRWFEDVKTTAWYESVEIFKQSQPDCWDNVIDEICEKLVLLQKNKACNHS